MFGPKPISLPSPFSHEHQPQRLYTQPTRPTPSGQCHFRMLNANSTEQRCQCQGYQQDFRSAGSVCDCSHAACYHGQTVQTESPLSLTGAAPAGYPSSHLVDRLRKLEEAVQVEREIREKMLARERQSWEREIRVLREALTPFYKSEVVMHQRLAEIDDRIEGVLRDQAQVKTRIVSMEDAKETSNSRISGLVTNRSSADQKPKCMRDRLGPRDVLALYSASEGRTSISAEPLSPRQSTSIPAEQESPRSSGILNLVELPRPALSRHVLPPRLSPPAEADEPRSSGFLALDVKELINRRKLASSHTPSQAYNSPASMPTRSPPHINVYNTTPQSGPQSGPRTSPTNIHLNGSVVDPEDRAHKKRKHHGELMALDVLANVSAASPVIS